MLASDNHSNQNITINDNHNTSSHRNNNGDCDRTTTIKNMSVYYQYYSQLHSRDDISIIRIWYRYGCACRSFHYKCPPNACGNATALPYKDYRDDPLAGTEVRIDTNVSSKCTKGKTCPGTLCGRFTVYRESQQ